MDLDSILKKGAGPLDISSMLSSIGGLSDIGGLVERLRSEGSPSTSSVSETPASDRSEGIRKEIQELRTELRNTKREIMESISQSEYRTRELLLNVLNEINTLKG